MTKLRNSCNSSKKINGIVSLKIVMEKLQKRLSIGKKSSKFSAFNNDHYEDLGDSTYVPKDVKEGHFAVLAVDDNEEPKRFVMPLQYLTHPTFLRLLEQAAEEYGFDHGGALAIPCRPCELEGILAEKWHEERDSYNNMVKSC